jgi:hypothetical protein
MRKVKLMSKLAAGAAVILVGGFLMMSSCTEPEQSSSDFSGGETGGGGENLPNDPGQGGVPGGLDYCNDGFTNYDDDALADRYGVPKNCTIGAVTQLTALGSVIQFFAVGYFLENQPDNYTVTVTTGGGPGVAQVQVTSANGDLLGIGLNGPVVVQNGVPIYVGYDALLRPEGSGVVLYFVDLQNQFNLVAGESWAFNLVRWTNCLRPPDPGCFHPYAYAEMGCYNDADDDGDGFIDSLDPECYDVCGWIDPYWDYEDIPDPYVPATECNDGEDNDGDTFTDLADPDCTGICDDNESL